MTPPAPPFPASGRRPWAWLVASAVALLALVGWVAYDVVRYFSVDEQQLPNLVGMQYEQATRLLRSHGLDPVTFVEYVQGAAPGVVTSQSPLAGATVRRSRTVHLGVNTPPAAALLPDLIGMPERPAVARMAELNLPLTTTTYRASDRPAGMVIAQDPPGGQRLVEGGGLALVVSSGPERPAVTLPDLLGTDVDKAAADLKRLGVSRVEALPSSVSFLQPRAVVAMRPAPGEEVPPGTPVLLLYALATANVVEVPSLLGMPQWRAQLALSAARLRVGTITYVTDADRPEGVVEVRPEGYTVPGTPVFLTINGAPPSTPFPDLSVPGPVDGPDRGQGGRTLPPGPSGPADGSRLVPFTFDPTNMGVKRLLEQPFQLKLVVSDDQGERVVLDRRVGAGQTVSTSVPVYGQEAMLQTFIDDVFFQAWRP